MPHDHLADDLNRGARSGGESGRMSAQVMGTKMNAHQQAGLSYHDPG